ncbi:helix-turn-helix transcriptional regulator [Gordonia sp. VNK1]|uniref:helix-turn-helix transcriptional regulator n=1 Tax=Gordonia oleivorans TaxID=3156618 RepID=UPI0032B49DBB
MTDTTVHQSGHSSLHLNPASSFMGSGHLWHGSQEAHLMHDVDTRESLPSAEYERIFAVLDMCEQAATLEHFKHTLMDALHTQYGFPNTTFLAGPTFRSAFADSDPVTTGRITPIIDEYQTGWYRTDMFASAESFAALQGPRAISHRQLRRLPSTAVEYLEGFLYRRRLHSAAVLHLGLAADCHGLIGIFDSEGKDLPPTRVHALGLLAGQLSAQAKSMPGNPVPDWRTHLTPRQQEIGALVSDGLTNEEIAAVLRLEVDTVKKYVSRIFALTHVRNRAEFVKLVYTTPA